MIKVKVHIKNEHCYMDEDVWVYIKLPCVPNKGDTIFIQRKDMDLLEIEAKKSSDIAINYFPMWFYGKSSQLTDFNDADLSDMGFSDAILVHDVCYIVDKRTTINIELTSE